MGNYEGYWIVRLKNNETMDFERRCHTVSSDDPNLAIFMNPNENYEKGYEYLAMIPYRMIEYIKFIKED